MKRSSIGYRSYLLMYWSDNLDNPAATKHPVGVCDLLCSKASSLTHCSCVQNSIWIPLIMNSRRVASCLRCVQCVIFGYLLQKTTRAGTFSGRSTALFVWKYPILHPPLLGSKPAHRSILLTIEIEIDLPYLGPVAIRSHLPSLPYWKGKHSWCYRTKCSLLGCSVGAMCLVLPPHDGWSKFWVHIYSSTSHLLISGWSLMIFLSLKARMPNNSWCIVLSISS